MHRMGVNKTIIDYVSSFISKRRNNEVDIKCGVPQGDPMSMKLFSIAFNNTIEKIRERYPNSLAYADDLIIFHDCEEINVSDLIG